MPKLTITIDIPDEKAALFEGRDLMIVPVTNKEAGRIGGAMLAYAEWLTRICEKSSEPSDALIELRESFVWVISCMNRAVRYQQRPTEETLQ